MGDGWYSMLDQNGNICRRCGTSSVYRDAFELDHPCEYDVDDENNRGFQLHFNFDKPKSLLIKEWSEKSDAEKAYIKSKTKWTGTWVSSGPVFPIQYYDKEFVSNLKANIASISQYKKPPLTKNPHDSNLLPSYYAKKQLEKQLDKPSDSGKLNEGLETDKTLKTETKTITKEAAYEMAKIMLTAHGVTESAIKSILPDPSADPSTDDAC